MTERLHFHFSLSCIGEGNGNPLQCSCLENPRDGGAWWAAVYGVAQSRTQLKRFSSSSSSSNHLYELDPDAGKDWRQKEKEVAEDEIDSITDSRDMNLSKHWEIVKYREAWRDVVYGVAKSRTRLSDWITTNKTSFPLAYLWCTSGPYIFCY